MIDKDLARKGNRDSELLNNLLKPPEVPINIDEYLALGIQIANMSKAQRESLDFMLEKLKLDKK